MTSIVLSKILGTFLNRRYVSRSIRSERGCYQHPKIIDFSMINIDFDESDDFDENLSLFIKIIDFDQNYCFFDENQRFLMKIMKFT